jgi:hypothetical protein
VRRLGLEACEGGNDDPESTFSVPQVGECCGVGGPGERYACFPREGM